MLAGIRRPAGQEDHVEGGDDPGRIGRVGVSRGVIGASAGEDLAPGGGAQAVVQRVGFAHRAQIGGEVEQVAIRQPQRQVIGHRQREARPRQKAAQIADLAHGQEARGQAAGGLDLGAGQGVAQFSQRFAAQTGGHEQAVRLQRAGRLHDLADRVLGPVKRHDVNDQIQPVGQVQPLGIGGDMRIGESRLPKFRPGGDNSDACKGPVNLCQPILHFIERDSMQRVCRTQPVCAVAMQPQRLFVDQAAGGGGAVGGIGYGIHGLQS